MQYIHSGVREKKKKKERQETPAVVAAFLFGLCVVCLFVIQLCSKELFVVLFHNFLEYSVKFA